MQRLIWTAVAVNAIVGTAKSFIIVLNRLCLAAMGKGRRVHACGHRGLAGGSGADPVHERNIRNRTEQESRNEPNPCEGA